MNKNSKILILGASGLVGSAINQCLINAEYQSILTPTHNELELRSQKEIKNYFKKNGPEVVILTAAKVGGIMANSTFRADFILENLLIQTLVIEACIEFKVPKLLFMGSSCVYPKFAEIPIKEESLLSSSLEWTNEAYAVAKIAGIKLIENVRRQYGHDYFSVMPTNLYGKNDCFNGQNAHVIPALITKMFYAKKEHKKEFTVWGSGEALREFLHADDMARACIQLLTSKENIPHWINIGSGEEISIKDLAYLIKDLMNYEGVLKFDTSKPDGAPRKLLDSQLIKNYKWRPKISLREGLQEVITHFIQQQENNKIK